MGDTSKHLTYFKVENFKRFESFEMKDLGQFNLIVGDNNVGKTSVLEALLVDDFAFERAISFFNVLHIKHAFTNPKYRDLIFFNCRSQGKKVRNTSFQLEGSTFQRGVHWEFDFNNKNVVIKDDRSNIKQTASFLADGNLSEVGIPYISPFYRDTTINLANFYSEEIQRNAHLKHQFINGIKVMIPRLDRIEPYVPKDQFPSLLFYLMLDETPISLELCGDGTINLFRILIGIFSNTGGRLMIDEVDAGIHYSRLKQFWKTVLLAAKENDVQLFMTTHSEECMRYFKEVLEEDLPNLKNDVRNITLVENTKTKVVTAHTYNYEQFEHMLDVGNEIRS